MRDYVTPLHEYIYDNVYTKNILDFVGNQETNYELVLMADVLEHFDKEEGTKLLSQLLEDNDAVLVSVPKNVLAQGHAYHNEFEEHKAEWSRSELAEMGNTFFVADAASHIAFISKKHEVADMKKSMSAKNRKAWILAHPMIAQVLLPPKEVDGR